MKPMTSKIIFSDIYTLTPVIAAILVAIFTIITFISANNFERKNEELKSQLKEIQILREELIHIKEIVESKEKKIGLTKVSGVVSTLEQMLNNLGLKAKVIRPLKKNRIKEFTEEDAELEIKNIDLNKIVNLLYKIENSPVPIKIKSATVKTTFENPNIFILNLTASLISKPRTTGLYPWFKGATFGFLLPFIPYQNSVWGSSTVFTHLTSPCLSLRSRRDCGTG